jgi:hypothetical protein
MIQLEENTFYEILCKCVVDSDKQYILQGLHTKGGKYCFKVVEPEVLGNNIKRFVFEKAIPTICKGICPVGVYTTTIKEDYTSMSKGVVIQQSTGITLNSDISKGIVLDNLNSLLYKQIYVVEFDADVREGDNIRRRSRLSDDDVKDIEACSGIERTDYNKLVELTINSIPKQQATSVETTISQPQTPNVSQPKRNIDRQKRAFLIHVVRTSLSRQDPKKEMSSILGNNMQELCAMGRLPDDLDEALKKKGIIKSSLNELCGVAGGASTKKFVLGRNRVVRKVGRTSYITYKRQQISLTEARKLEKTKK